MKKALLIGLAGMMTASAFGAVLTMVGANPLQALYAAPESGAKEDRSVTVADYVRKGFYRKSTTGGVSFYDKTCVSFELTNKGGYGFIELICSDYGKIENIADGLFDFTCQQSTQRIFYFSFEDDEDFYDSEEDANAGINVLPIYNFAYKSVSSIIIKMGDRNEGTLAPQAYYDLSYDEGTKTYTISGMDNIVGLYVYSSAPNAFFHIESITFNYNC